MTGLQRTAQLTLLLLGVLAFLTLAPSHSARAQEPADGFVDLGVTIDVPGFGSSDNDAVGVTVRNHGTLPADDVEVDISVLRSGGHAGLSVARANVNDPLDDIDPGELILSSNHVAEPSVWRIGRIGARSSFSADFQSGSGPTALVHQWKVSASSASFESDSLKRNNEAEAWAVTYLYATRRYTVPAVADYWLSVSAANPLPATDGSGKTELVVTVSRPETCAAEFDHELVGPGCHPTEFNDAYVDIDLTPGLSAGSPTFEIIRRLHFTVDPMLVNMSYDSYDNNTGRFVIGDSDFTGDGGYEHFSMTLPVTVAAGATLSEQCITAEVFAYPPPPYDDPSDNLARVCLGSPLISDGQVSLFTWYDCVGETDYPCDGTSAANNNQLQLVVVPGEAAVDTPPDQILQPADVVVHVSDSVGRRADAGDIVWSTGFDNPAWPGARLYDAFPGVDNWGGAGGSGRVAITYSGPAGSVLESYYRFGEDWRSLWDFDANGAYEDLTYSLYFGSAVLEFSALGTYTMTFTIEGDHDSGTPAVDTDDASHSDTETYTFHVGPIADLEVGDGGASSEARSDQLALTIKAVNYGPDDAVGAEVTIDLTLPDGVWVAEAIASEGMYSGTRESGTWDLGAFELGTSRRGIGLPEAATLTLILEGDDAASATATVAISHDDMRPYTVCLEVDHGNIEEVDAHDEEECEGDHGHGHGHDGTWYEGTVYDHIDDNNEATVRARPGVGRSPAEQSAAAIAVKWRAVGDQSGFRVSHYQVWRSSCAGEQPRQVADQVRETTWVDLNVMAGQTYCYQVRAVSGWGLLGPFSRVMEKTALVPVAITAGAPDRPALSATALGQERILLSWQTPDGNGVPITAYTLQVANRSGGPWTDVAPQPGLNAQSYVYPPSNNERLTGGTRKYFRLRAANSRGVGEWSPVVGVATNPADAAGKPTNVRAYPDRVLPGSVLVVTWRKPASDGGADITGYEVQWSANGSSGWRSAGRVDAGTLRFEHTGLGFGATRHYRVAARTARGLGAWSDVVATVTAVQTPGASLPGAPTNLTLAAGTQHIRASWSAPASDGGSRITGYRVQFREGRSGAWDKLTAVPGGTSTPLHGLPNGVEYQVRVAAVNAAGAGPYTTPQSATPHFPPGAPRNLSLTAGDSRITARWDPPELPGNPNLNGYQVQYREAGGEWQNANHRGTATEATIRGLTNGNTYEVRVAALSAPGGKSGYTQKSANLP